jgi:hypothetical protein
MESLFSQRLIVWPFVTSSKIDVLSGDACLETRAFAKFYDARSGSGRGLKQSARDSLLDAYASSSSSFFKMFAARTMSRKTAAKSDLTPALRLISGSAFLAARYAAISRALARWKKWNLIALDEMGYVPLADVGAEMLFQVIADRAEKAAVIITTNLPFSEWSSVFPNTRLCKALLDRITDRAHTHQGGKATLRTRDRTGFWIESLYPSKKAVELSLHGFRFCAESAIAWTASPYSAAISSASPSWRMSSSSLSASSKAAVTSCCTFAAASSSSGESWMLR